jgi:hypothetical protein
MQHTSIHRGEYTVLWYDSLKIRENWNVLGMDGTRWDQWLALVDKVMNLRLS